MQILSVQENVKISFYDLREAYYISWMQPIVQMRCRRNTTLRQRYTRTRNFKCSTRSNFESNFSSYKMWSSVCFCELLSHSESQVRIIWNLSCSYPSQNILRRIYFVER